MTWNVIHQSSSEVQTSNWLGHSVTVIQYCSAMSSYKTLRSIRIFLKYTWEYHILPFQVHDGNGKNYSVKSKATKIWKLTAAFTVGVLSLFLFYFLTIMLYPSGTSPSIPDYILALFVMALTVTVMGGLIWTILRNEYIGAQVNAILRLNEFVGKFSMFPRMQTSDLPKYFLTFSYSSPPPRTFFRKTGWTRAHHAIDYT